MKKRCKKKQDKKLYKAIYELNEYIAEDLEIEFDGDGVDEAFEATRDNPHVVKRIFSDHKKYVGK